MGGGIRTGARTGVELNKKGEVDEGADNNGWAGEVAEGNWGPGEATAEHANCI